MRFVLALIAFVVAAAMIAVGIAQRTVLLPADHVASQAQIADGVHYVVVPGSVLRGHPGEQRLQISGTGTVFAAYARTADIEAWLAGQRYERLVWDATTGDLGRGAVTTAPAVAGVTNPVGSLPDPNGSDLWYDQKRAQRSVDWTVNVPATVSLLIASTGTAPAPSDVTISWPVDASTPSATPLIVGGSVLLLAGLFLYIWALIQLRRRRGPRRRPPPKMPKLPAPPRYKPVQPSQPIAARGRRAAKFTALAGGILATGIVLSGCTPQAVLPAPTTTATQAPSVQAAVTQQQATRIVADAADVAASADKAHDATLLATRFTGPALEVRQAAYTAHKTDKSFALPQAIPTTGAELQVVLPQATTSWPRTLFAVVTGGTDAKVPPVALTLTQQTPREQYLVQYEVSLERDMPAVPSAAAGTSRITPDTKLLAVSPSQLAKDYGEVLLYAKAKTKSLFDSSHDELLADAGPDAKKAAVKKLGTTAKLTFADVPADPSTIVAMATADSGAIVSVYLEETWTVKPAKSGVTVKPSGGTKALSKVSATTKGIVSTYGYQLLFSVSSATADKPVTLLGYAQGLVSAKEL